MLSRAGTKIQSNTENVIAHKELPRIRGAIARDRPNSHNAVGCNRSQRFERRDHAQKFEFTRIQDDVIA